MRRKLNNMGIKLPRWDMKESENVWEYAFVGQVKVVSIMAF
jgi:hypothetical protein